MEAMFCSGFCISQGQEKQGTASGNLTLRDNWYTVVSIYFSCCFKNYSGSKAGSLDKRWYVSINTRMNRNTGKGVWHFQTLAVRLQTTRLGHAPKAFSLKVLGVPRNK